MSRIGPKKTVEFAHSVGISSFVPVVPSIALGSADLTLIEMLRAYTMFPNRGFNTEPIMITRIEDKNGNVLESFVPESKQIISEVDAYTMYKMMEGVMDFGTGHSMRGRFGINAAMGGKTGTTNDNADAWFMGYVPQLMAGTWIGCDDRFIRIENDLGMGGQAARPIWEAFFKKIYADKSLGMDKQARFAKPADLQNESNNADISSIIDDTTAPGAEGRDVGVGNATDFGTIDSTHNYIPAESQAPIDEDNPQRKAVGKDSAGKKGTKIGDPQPADEKKKKGFFKKLFGKKDATNDY